MPVALKKKKERIDVLLTEKGYVDSRTKAQSIILAGVVFIDNQRIDKPGQMVNPDAIIEVKENTLPYVSRGGLKLKAALDTFPIQVEGKICADIGASTGGFTDCMLQHGAKKVYAIDVGYGQLDSKLRKDPRVVVMEKINARHLVKTDVPEEMDMVTIDVSFISLKYIIPVAKEILKAGGTLVTLVKPQFEAGRKEIEKGGVVKDPKVREAVIKEITEFTKQSGFAIRGVLESPVHGPAGNIESLLWSEKES